MEPNWVLRRRPNLTQTKERIVLTGFNKLRRLTATCATDRFVRTREQAETASSGSFTSTSISSYLEDSLQSGRQETRVGGGVLGILQTSPRENDREIEKREIRGKNIAAASIGLHTKKESEARNVEQGERRPRLRSRRGVRRHCIDRGLRSLHVDPRLFFSFFSVGCFSFSLLSPSSHSHWVEKPEPSAKRASSSSTKGVLVKLQFILFVFSSFALGCSYIGFALRRNGQQG